MTTYSVALSADKQTDITVEEYGSGRPFMLMHGGAGPQSMIGFASRLAASEHAHVYVPTHPGFGGTARPDWLNNISALAETYVKLIEQLDLRDVAVVGGSIGGWIAAEMALRHSTRISSFIMIDAVGIVVGGQPIVDIFPLTLDEVMQLSYHNPVPFRPDPTKLTDADKRGLAANRQALAVYGGQPSTGDPTLAKRLSAVTTPTLVVWGDSDGIVSPDYGRAFAAAIPNAKFQLLPDAGHMPQIETPDQLLTTIRNFINVLVAKPLNTH